jgi:hypothetical protein
MQAKRELTQLRERLKQQIAALESEMATIDKAIELLEREDQSSPNAPYGKRFRKVGLSDAIRQVVASVWISPTEVRDELMHGGYPNEDKNKLLASVFATMKRLGKSGGFEVRRIEGKLKYRVQQRASTNQEAVASQHANGSGPLRKTQIHEWLKQNGPATRGEILKGTELPGGTVGAYLSSEKELFESRDGKWHAR